MKNSSLRCGYVAIVGRPNVGKSTLLNRLLGKKISITSRKPQTTRHRILGIKTLEQAQVVYVDTPGLHQREKRALNRYMNRTADAVLHDVDLIVLIVDGRRWTSIDEWILEKLKTVRCPVVLVVNKVDKIPDKNELLPRLQEYGEKFNFTEVVPLSAKTGNNIDSFETVVSRFLPEGPHLFPDDLITDRSERFLAAERIREKLIRTVGQEVPYAITVEIEDFKRKGNILHVSAMIWVEREGQKAILIGKEGAQLKEVGRVARLELEKMFGLKVFLRLWVKVKAGWSDDTSTLQRMGYNES